MQHKLVSRSPFVSTVSVDAAVDAATVPAQASIDAFMAVGLYDAGYRHIHLDECVLSLWQGA